MKVKELISSNNNLLCHETLDEESIIDNGAPFILKKRNSDNNTVTDCKQNKKPKLTSSLSIKSTSKDEVKIPSTKKKTVRFSDPLQTIHPTLDTSFLKETWKRYLFQKENYRGYYNSIDKTPLYSTVQKTTSFRFQINKLGLSVRQGSALHDAIKHALQHMNQEVSTDVAKMDAFKHEVLSYLASKNDAPTLQKEFNDLIANNLSIAEAYEEKEETIKKLIKPRRLPNTSEEKDNTQILPSKRIENAKTKTFMENLNEAFNNDDVYKSILHICQVSEDNVNMTQAVSKAIFNILQDLDKEPNQNYIHIATSLINPNAPTQRNVEALLNYQGSHAEYMKTYADWIRQNDLSTPSLLSAEALATQIETACTLACREEAMKKYVALIRISKAHRSYNAEEANAAAIVFSSSRMHKNEDDIPSENLQGLVDDIAQYQDILRICQEIDTKPELIEIASRLVDPTKSTADNMTTLRNYDGPYKHFMQKYANCIQGNQEFSTPSPSFQTGKELAVSIEAKRVELFHKNNKNNMSELGITYDTTTKSVMIR